MIFRQLNLVITLVEERVNYQLRAILLKESPCLNNLKLIYEGSLKRSFSARTNRIIKSVI